jgi:hypothetical protein
MRRSTCSVCFVALLAGLCVAPAAARDNELSLTLGYTHLSLDAELEFLDITEITSLDDTGGIYGGIRFSRSIFVEQLRLGSGVQVARYSTDGRRSCSSRGGSGLGNGSSSSRASAAG